MRPRVLVVDDEARMRDLLTLHLRGSFDVETAASGAEALRLLSARPFQLVILDVLMPGEDGWSVCQKIRAMTSVPVIMLTALSGVEEKLEAFAAGADDYVTKPFDARELVARAQALIRRTEGERASRQERPRPAPLTFPGMTIDPAGRLVFADGKLVTLSPKEFDLLYHLASHHNTVFTREELLRDVWQDAAYVETRTVDSHVKTLREKLGRDGPGRALVTVWGVGYKFHATEGGEEWPA